MTEKGVNSEKDIAVIIHPDGTHDLVIPNKVSEFPVEQIMGINEAMRVLCELVEAALENEPS